MAGEDIERLRQAALKDPAQTVRLADALVANDRAEEAVHACRKRAAEASRRRAAEARARSRAVGGRPDLEEAQAALLEAVARQQKQKAAGGAPSRGPAPPPQPTPISRLQPMDDTSPSLPSFEEAESDRGSAATTMRPGAAGSRRSRMALRRRQRWDEEYQSRATPAPPRATPAGVLACDAGREPSSEGVDLGAVANQLFGNGSDSEEEEQARWQSQLFAAVDADPVAATWDARRARAFVWLWVSLGAHHDRHRRRGAGSGAPSSA